MIKFRNCLRKLVNFNVNARNIGVRCYSKNISNDDDVEIDDVDQKSHVGEGKRKPVISSGVKLYPGFQKSVEDKNEFDAKKVIEDFYGLNELEYENAEKGEDDKNINQTEAVLKKLQRDPLNAVLDVGSVIALLKRENIENLCCISIPEELQYANYMIIGTCKSARHIRNTFINVNKVYKLFKENDDQFIKKSGKNSDKWCAIDMGNIVIHLFNNDYRKFYDLETLWTVGYEFDDNYQDFMAKQNEINSRFEIIDETVELK